METIKPTSSRMNPSPVFVGGGRCGCGGFTRLEVDTEDGRAAGTRAGKQFYPGGKQTRSLNCGYINVIKAAVCERRVFIERKIKSSFRGGRNIADKLQQMRLGCHVLAGGWDHPSHERKTGSIQITKNIWGEKGGSMSPSREEVKNHPSIKPSSPSAVRGAARLPSELAKLLTRTRHGRIHRNNGVIVISHVRRTADGE